MRYRALPRSGIELSEICFGAMRFVPSSGSLDPGRRALAAALDAGVNVIHSSEQYGPFDALSQLLAERPERDELHHVVKVHAPEYGEERFDAGALRAEIERVLRALHTERITVVQHLQRGPAGADAAYNALGDEERIPLLPRVAEPLRELTEELKHEGKIAELMSFPHTVPFAQAVLRDTDVDGFVHFFGPLETEMVPLLAELEQRNMAFIPIRPLLQGMLTDRRADRDALPEDDRMRGAAWDPWYALRDQIAPLLDHEGRSWSEVALRFALAPKVVTTAVLSMNTEAQVNEAVRACDGAYPSEELVRQVDRVIAAGGRIPKETLM